MKQIITHREDVTVKDIKHLDWFYCLTCKTWHKI